MKAFKPVTKKELRLLEKWTEELWANVSLPKKPKGVRNRVFLQYLKLLHVDLMAIHEAGQSWDDFDRPIGLDLS